MHLQSFFQARQKAHQSFSAFSRARARSLARAEPVLLALDCVRTFPCTRAPSLLPPLIHLMMMGKIYQRQTHGTGRRERRRRRRQGKGRRKGRTKTGSSNAPNMLPFWQKWQKQNLIWAYANGVLQRQKDTRENTPYSSSSQQYSVGRGPLTTLGLRH